MCLTYSHVQLHGGASHLEVAQIVAALFRRAELNAANRETDPPDTIEALCADFPKGLSGGLAFLDSNITIKPSPLACFPESLSAWRQLLDIGKMPEDHGPYAYVEVQDDNFLMSKYDVMLEDIQPPTHFDRTQLKVALENVQQDIRDFLLPLRSWAMCYYPADAEELVACFTRVFVDSDGDRNH
jgi:hypothetical protein